MILSEIRMLKNSCHTQPETLALDNTSNWETHSPVITKTHFPFCYRDCYTISLFLYSQPWTTHLQPTANGVSSDSKGTRKNKPSSTLISCFRSSQFLEDTSFQSVLLFNNSSSSNQTWLNSWFQKISEKHQLSSDLAINTNCNRQSS